MKLIAAIKTFVLFLAVCSMVTPALAEENEDITAYVVASDTVFNSLTGMKSYCENEGVPFVQIKDKKQLKDVEKCLVIDNPSEESLAGDIIRACLNEKEMKDANTMGKGVLAEKNYEGKQVLVFATAYSINTFVKSHADEWKDVFEAWYYIARSITSIIGY